MSLSLKNTLLFVVFSSALTLVPSAFASFAERGNIFDQNYYENEMREDFTDAIKNQNIPEIKNIIVGTFSSPADAAYFEKLASKYKPQNLHISSSEARGQVSIFGDSLDVLLSQFDHEKKSLHVNGVLFKFEKGKSLEYHVQKMTAILSRRKSAHELLKSLILPEAQAASKETDAWNSVFYVIPKAILNVNTYSLQSGLEESLEACEKRNGKTPFERSQVFVRLGFMKAKGVYTVEGQRQIKDCSAWVAQDSRVDKLGSAKLLKLCETGAKLARCVDAYQAESARSVKSQGSSPGPRSNSNKTAQ